MAFVTAILFSFVSFIKAQTKKKPNILILQADDLGYSDLNCYGGIAHTPNIDALAQNGIQFDNFYAAAPNCSPSRAGILTGRHPSRAGIYSYIPAGSSISYIPAGSSIHLQNEEITLAELLNSEGYQTVHFGKWHLGCLSQGNDCQQPQPQDQGFDYSFGTEANAEPSHHNPVNFVRNGNPLDTLKGFSCQLLVEEAKRWLKNESDKNKPFFFYLNFHEPHQKIASPLSLIDKYHKFNRNKVLSSYWNANVLPSKYDEFDRFDAKYYANVENMDRAVGELLNILRVKGELKNTLIFFTSDNGSYHKGSQPNLRGYKGEIYDGGIKVPGIIYWPEHFLKAKIVDEPVWYPDILPTLCDLLNISLPEKTLDGTSILPILEGKNFDRENPMFWFFYRGNPEAAMRIGDYSLVGFTGDSIPRTHYFSQKDTEFIQSAKFEKFELYDLERDPGQQHNLADSLPQKLNAMKTIFKKTFRDIVEEGPFWRSLPVYDPENARLKWKYERHR